MTRARNGSALKETGHMYGTIPEKNTGYLISVIYTDKQ